MLFIDSEGNYPLFRGDIRLVSPDWDFGDELPEGFELVESSEYPEFDSATETVSEVAPVRNENGVYVQTFEVRLLTEEELEIRNAPMTARQKLLDLGFTEHELVHLVRF